jgi:hypothetical protein
MLPNERPGVDAGWRVLFGFQRKRPRATQAGCSALGEGSSSHWADSYCAWWWIGRKARVERRRYRSRCSEWEAHAAPAGFRFLLARLRIY